MNMNEDNDKSISTSKFHKVLTDFGTDPLTGTPIQDGPLEGTPDILLAMVLDAMLKSRPISHDLSQRAVNKVIEAGYHDIERLRGSTWEERTMVLKDGGYSRYREQAASNLGDLAEVVSDVYGTFFCLFLLTLLLCCNSTLTSSHMHIRVTDRRRPK